MNVCPRGGMAYDSYYNETDRVNSTTEAMGETVTSG